MATKPTIYVLAGANGIGKTTVNPFFIPKGVPYINADDIARQFRERHGGNMNVQELANAEAIERLNQFIAKRQNVAIESNLADNETWQFLLGIQGLGYAIHLNFFGTSEVDICIDRVLQGGHFVRPDIVKARYEVGLLLLRQYLSIPDVLILTDNTTSSVNIAELKFGEIVFQTTPLPPWVQFVFATDSKSNAPLSTIDEVREKYRQMKKKD